MVPVTGIEPVQCFHRGILSPLRLPVPPHRLIYSARNILAERDALRPRLARLDAASRKVFSFRYTPFRKRISFYFASADAKLCEAFSARLDAASREAVSAVYATTIRRGCQFRLRVSHHSYPPLIEWGELKQGRGYL